jgi:hypothetical protein
LLNKGYTHTLTKNVFCWHLSMSPLPVKHNQNLFLHFICFAVLLFSHFILNLDFYGMQFGSLRVKKIYYLMCQISLLTNQNLNITANSTIVPNTYCG